MLTGGLVSPPHWQWAVDLIRVLEVVGCVPLLFLSASRVWQAPSYGQRALGVSSCFFIVTAAYGLLDNLGRPATPRIVLVAVGLIAGLWGGWRFFVGDTLREPRRQTRDGLITDGDL